MPDIPEFKKLFTKVKRLTHTRPYCKRWTRIHDVYTAGGGNGYTLNIHTAGIGNGYNLHVHTAGGGKGYTLHGHTAGCENGHTLHVHRRLLMVLLLLYDV
jgi:hypothetical protein